MNLFIGCSSRDNIPSKYYDRCKKLLDELFKREYDLVFGACNKGLMGLAYNLALKYNRNIIGIYPEFYAGEAKELECESIPVKTVNDRTDSVINKGDILVFLPGGIGTVYELFMAIESKRAGEHDKLIIIYNIDEFYNDLFLQLDKMYNENFTSLEDNGYYHIFNDYNELVEYLDNYNKKTGMLKRRKI